MRCVICITIGIQRIYRKTLAHTSLRVLMRIRSACYNNVSVQLYNIYLDLSVFLHSGKIIIREIVNQPASSSQKRSFFLPKNLVPFFPHTHTIVCRTAPICILHYATYYNYTLYNLNSQQQSATTTTVYRPDGMYYKTNRRHPSSFFPRRPPSKRAALVNC